MRLQLRGRHGVGPEPDLLLAGARAAQPVPARFAADRRRRPAHDQQGHAELRPQHGRQPDLPELRHSASPASIDFAGIGGNTNFIKPRVRVRALPAAQPPHVGRLPHAGRVHPAVSASPRYLPITETLYLGGEYTIRGFDIRSIGPRDPLNRPGARRQQDAAVQRRVPDQHRRPGAPGAVLRHRPGARRSARASRGRKTSPCTVDPGAAADRRSVLVHAAGQSERAAAIRAA